jgi:hypothetical protein
MIRTGGEQRVSNFLLWGAAYSELFFSDILWPDFQANTCTQAIAAYQRRQRRFGLVLFPQRYTLGPCPTRCPAPDCAHRHPDHPGIVYVGATRRVVRLAGVAMTIAAWEFFAMTHPTTPPVAGSAPGSPSHSSPPRLPPASAPSTAPGSVPLGLAAPRSHRPPLLPRAPRPHPHGPAPHRRPGHGPVVPRRPHGRPRPRAHLRHLRPRARASACSP